VTHERTALIVDCEPVSDAPVVLRPVTPGGRPIALTRAETQDLIDDAAHVLDLLDTVETIATGTAP